MNENNAGQRASTALWYLVGATSVFTLPCTMFPAFRGRQASHSPSSASSCWWRGSCSCGARARRDVVATRETTAHHHPLADRPTYAPTLAEPPTAQSMTEDHRGARNLFHRHALAVALIATATAYGRRDHRERWANLRATIRRAPARHDPPVRPPG